MKKIIILIVLTLIVNLSFGQTEKADNKVVTEKFVRNYNDDDYNGIFSMFADAMKEALPTWINVPCAVAVTPRPGEALNS